MIFKTLKKTLAVCLLGVGCGMLLVLLLPISWWFFIIGIALLCMGITWLSC